MKCWTVREMAETERYRNTRIANAVIMRIVTVT